MSGAYLLGYPMMGEIEITLRIKLPNNGVDGLMTKWTNPDEPEPDLIEARKRAREQRERFEDSFRAGSQLWWEELVEQLDSTIEKAIRKERIDIRIHRAAPSGHFNFMAVPEPYFEVKVFLDLQTRTLKIDRERRPSLESTRKPETTTERLELNPTPQGRVQLTHREAMEAILNPVLDALLPS